MKPPNFSWIVDGLLAGSSFPADHTHFDYYKKHGISNVVTFTEYRIPKQIIPPGFKVTYMPIIEFTPPTLRQSAQFVNIVETAKEKGERVVCHCYWGRGRTGTMLASYLVKHGTGRSDHEEQTNQGAMAAFAGASHVTTPNGPMTAHEAINYVRNLRPYSVETRKQEQAVVEYEDFLKSGGNVESLKKLPKTNLYEDVSDIDDDEFVFY